MGDQNEGTKVVNIVVGVLLMLVVMAAVVAFVMWGAGKFNSTQKDMQDQVNAVEIAKYNQYDDNEVSGTDVLTAVKTYKNSDMCIFVSTKKMNGGAVYDFSRDDITAAPTGNKVYAVGTNAKSDGSQTIEYNNDMQKFAAEVIVDNPANNSNYTKLTTKDQDPYINPNGKFWACLVYDKYTEEVAGILFRQTK